MKNSNGQKGHQSPETQHNKDQESDPEVSQMWVGYGSEEYEKNEGNLDEAHTLGALKDNFRLNPTGSDDDLAIDIQDAIGREMSLSLVADNIHVRVEDEIVTLEGEVYREEERKTAGDIATAFSGDDNVNNYLSVVHNRN
jgi:osmotically-inducible protein OsmY